MQKSLYIAPKKGLKIKRDGPSVWITSEGEAGRRVPVRLIERVVVVGDVSVPCSVVTLFTSKGIPVLFFNPEERESALCLSTKPATLRFSGRQSVFTASEYNIQRFNNLIRSWRSRVMKDFLRRLFNKDRKKDVFFPIIKDSDYKKLIYRIAGSKKDVFITVRTFLKSLLLEDILTILKKMGFDPHQGVLHQGKRYGLAHDLTYVFEPEITLMALRFVKSPNYDDFVLKERIMTEGLKDMVVRYENRRNHIKQQVWALTDELGKLLHELEAKGVMKLISAEDSGDGAVSYLL